MHPHIVNDILRLEKELWQYQVIQESPTRFRVLAVPTETCDREQFARRVAGGFTSHFGEEVTAEITFVDSIDRTATGKHRTVVSYVGRNEGEAT